MSLARKMAISVILSAVVLAVVVHLAGARETAAAAWEAGLPALATVGATLLILLFSQAAAWAALERKMGHRPPFRTLLAATTVAMAGNILTPASHLGGEPAKVLYAGRRTGLPYTELAGTVLLCKYIEAMSFVLFLGFATAAALVSFRDILFAPAHAVLGGAIVALAAASVAAGVVLWMSLARRWTLLTAAVGLLARLRIRPAFFADLGERVLRMETAASRMFREEGRAVLAAFAWYVLVHAALFVRPLAFFYLGWRTPLSAADLGMIFLTSQVLLAVQLMPSGAGMLDGGLLAMVSIVDMGISVPQCTVFLLCLRFWDALAVAAGATLAGRAGMSIVRRGGKGGT